MNIGAYDNDINDKQSRNRRQYTTKYQLLYTVLQYVRKVLQVSTLSICTFISLLLILSSFILTSNDDTDNKQQSTMISIGMAYIFIVKPILSTLYIVLCSSDIDGTSHSAESNGGVQSQAQTATNLITTRIIALTFLLSIICNQFPKWLSKLVACIAVFVFGLSSRQLSSSSTSHTNTTTQTDQASATDNSSNYSNTTTIANRLQRVYAKLGLKERAVLGAIFLVTSLLIENFIIWVVSATYQPGINGDFTPLQDNGRLIFESIAMKIYNVKAPWQARRYLQRLRDGLNVQWALVSSLGSSLVCLELQLGHTSSTTPSQRRQQRTLAGVAFHALTTLASARIIRTISFALTVLPSQVSNCYASHFPLPPEEWREWLMVGFLPNTRGGCNDLILSGHATVTSTIACAFTSVAANTKFSVAVWTLVALDYAIESYQGLHYSVDMWLGCIVTCLLWQLTKSCEFGSGVYEMEEQRRSGKHKESKAASPLDAKVVSMYALPAVIAFMVLTVVPEAYINYFLVGYSAWAGIILARQGFTNFLQHVLLCELCFGLGAYL